MTAAALQNVGLMHGWVLGEEPWGDEMNANLRALDALVQASAKDKDLTAPPGSPAAGDVYIVGGSPTGAWSSHAGEVARYSGTAWEFYEPKEGWAFWLADENIQYTYNGTAWVSSSTTLGVDAMIFRGVIDCSANPNYPAADAGDVYKVSVAGKIGGGPGPNVQIGDTLYCTVDATSSGNHATVGANWSIVQANIDGAVVGPASVTDSRLALFDGTTGKLIKESTLTAAIDAAIGSTRGSILRRGASNWELVTPGTAGHVLTSNGSGADPTYQAAGSSTLPVLIELVCSDETTALTTGAGKVTFRAPFAFTLTQVRGSLGVAQATGSALQVDVNESGTSVLSTKLTFDNTEKTTVSASTPAVISDASIADDAEITVDIDTVGDGTAKGLKITLIGTRPVTVPTPYVVQVAVSDELTALTTGTAKVTFRMPQAMTVTAVRASLSTAQASGSIFTVDINESGSTILSTKLTIDNTEKTSVTAATAAVLTDTSLADDAEITIDIDQVGDGSAKGLKVSIIGTI